MSYGNELVHLKIKKNILNMIKWNSKEEVCQLSVHFLKKTNRTYIRKMSQFNLIENITKNMIRTKNMADVQG